jgi:DNA polymerase IIIc chi subunit
LLNHTWVHACKAHGTRQNQPQEPTKIVRRNNKTKRQCILSGTLEQVVAHMNAGLRVVNKIETEGANRDNAQAKAEKAARAW